MYLTVYPSYNAVLDPEKLLPLDSGLQLKENVSGSNPQCGPVLCAKAVLWMHIRIYLNVKQNCCHWQQQWNSTSGAPRTLTPVKISVEGNLSRWPTLMKHVSITTWPISLTYRIFLYLLPSARVRKAVVQWDLEDHRFPISAYHHTVVITFKLASLCQSHYMLLSKAFPNAGFPSNDWSNL